MRKVIIPLLALLILFPAASGFAASETLVIQGKALLQGQINHAGTRVSVEIAFVPSLTVAAIILLLLGTSILLKQRQTSRIMIFMLAMLTVRGSLADLVVLTGSTGVFSLTNPSGQTFTEASYRLSFDHAGYFSKTLSAQVTSASGKVLDVGTVTLSTLPDAGALVEVDGILGSLRLVPPSGEGGFVQGSPQSEPGRSIAEPQFTHVMTRSIAVMETEVSRGMWADVRQLVPSLPADPSQVTYGAGLNHPVNKVTWKEALLFANLMSSLNGLQPCYYKDTQFLVVLNATNYETGEYFCDFDALGYRLPTEGEWEYICRAGSQTAFSVTVPTYTTATAHLCTAGLHPLLEGIAVFCGNDAGGSAPVKSKQPNSWNVYDLHGNVSEWCWDWFPIITAASSPYYPTGSVIDYAGSATGTHRTSRGGSWNHRPDVCRSAFRSNVSPQLRLVFMGFRLVRTLQ